MINSGRSRLVHPEMAGGRARATRARRRGARWRRARMPGQTVILGGWSRMSLQALSTAGLKDPALLVTLSALLALVHASCKRVRIHFRHALRKSMVLCQSVAAIGQRFTGGVGV